MKVAFVGKGGSGKTTLSSLFIRYLVDQRRVVLAFDADINQHLAMALGADEVRADAIPALGGRLTMIKEYLRGDNPRIGSAESMVKTTPAGSGSRLLTVSEQNPIYADCVHEIGGARLAVTGPFSEADLGVACYHSKVGAVELILNHLVDAADEYVVVDMTAGADSFASGLFTRFDVTFLVCEPTKRSIGVYRQYRDYAREFGVRIYVIGNKIIDQDDLSFLRSEVGDELLAWVGRSDHVRAAERGDVAPISQLEPSNLAALATLQGVVDQATKDWDKFQRQAVDFHLRNATAWANDRAGADLSAQVDPDFIHGPAALVRSGVAPAAQM
jgi:CO dehydrogenase maturation factor